LQCYKGYIFSISKCCILTYSFRIQIGRSFNEGFLSSTIKEIIAVKDNIYDFVENFESGGYRSLGERRNGRSG